MCSRKHLTRHTSVYFTCIIESRYILSHAYIRFPYEYIYIPTHTHIYIFLNNIYVYIHIYIYIREEGTPDMRVLHVVYTSS